MENNTKNPVNKENVKVTHHVERTNLHDFGYEKSGNVKGDPEIYASYLQRIVNGDLVEENYKGISEEEKKEKREKMQEYEKKLYDIEKTNEKYEGEIKVKEKKIEEYREELLQTREKRSKDHESLFRDTFSPLKFSIVLFFLLMLTGYLFFFYVSASYKALYVDFDKIANDLAEGISIGSIMPPPYELAEALRFNFLLFLIPFVFYGFGWAFHILLEMKHKLKMLFISLLILVTFMVDFLIAIIIHNNTESAKELMGLATKKWNQSPTFYIILCLGFLVYIIWSILLDSLLREWSKRQVVYNMLRIIKHLKNDIKTLQKKILPVETLENRINLLKEDIGTIVFGNLKGYIDQFTTGWISYLAPESMKEIKNKCLGIKQNFEEKYNIQPGIVKVISQKKIKERK